MANPKWCQCPRTLLYFFLTFHLLRDATLSFDQSHDPYDYGTSPTNSVQAHLPLPAPSPKSEWCQYNDCLKGKWVPRNRSFKNLAEFQEHPRTPLVSCSHPFSLHIRLGLHRRGEGCLGDPEVSRSYELCLGAHRGYAQDEKLASGGVCCPDVEDSGRVDIDRKSVV